MSIATGTSGLRRLELEALLEITEAATSHLDLEELLRVVVERIASVIEVDRCSAILADGETDEAIVIASHDVPELRRLPIDLRRYPEVQYAMESREPVVIDDVRTDPVMEGVRSLLSSLPVSSLVVAPLVAKGDAYGALYLRLARDRAFAPEEQTFLRAAASTLANSVRNASLHTSVRRRRDELEASYIERYRELDRVNELLRETSRIKDELMAIVSHDVRAPLSVLLGHTRLLLAAPLEPAHQRSVEAIERQGLRVLELVQQILERGRDSGAELVYARGDLAALARKVANDLSTLGAEKEIEVVARGLDALELDFDESAIRQVLENLISNAITHAPEQSAVEVHVSFDEAGTGRARIEVRDQGPGILASELPLVFERHRKGAETSGFGLGLAIAREIVERHGGDIWVRSMLGEGTSFFFSVPLQPPATEGEEERRVLVIAECPELRASLTERLRGTHALTLTRTGSEGANRARSLLPDVVLIERALPGAEAGASARLILRQPGLAEVPVVFVGPPDPVADERLRASGLLDGRRGVHLTDEKRILSLLEELRQAPGAADPDPLPGAMSGAGSRP